MNYCLFASKQGLLFESHALFEGVNIIGMGVNIVRIRNVAGDVLSAFEDASRTSVSLKILYLCRSVRGLLPAYGLLYYPEKS